MKKLFLWLCGIAMCGFQAKAQTPDSLQVPYEVMRDSVLKHLSMADVGSGLLADNTFALVPYERYLPPRESKAFHLGINYPITVQT